MIIRSLQLVEDVLVLGLLAGSATLMHLAARRTERRRRSEWSLLA
jgi:hypothetical protein